MSESEFHKRNNLDKSKDCYLAWKMDWKFREILNKTTPNYLQHLKSLPSRDDTDSIHQRAKWSHSSVQPPKIHNFFKKVKGDVENSDWKCDGISDTDSIRTEDFESRFTELLVPAPSVGSESQEIYGVDLRDSVDINKSNDVMIAKEELLEFNSAKSPSAANARCSEASQWKTPDIDKQSSSFESSIMIPKSFMKEVKHSRLEKMEKTNIGIEQEANAQACSSNIETFTKMDDNQDKFQQLPDNCQDKFRYLIGERETYSQPNNTRTYQENLLKQKVEQLVAENIKLSAENALLFDELKEIKDKEQHRKTSEIQKLQDSCINLRADNQTLRTKCTELENTLKHQSESLSDLTQQNTQFNNQIIQLENNEKFRTEKINKLNADHAINIAALKDQIKNLKEQLCHEKELHETKSKELQEKMSDMEKQANESLSKLDINHQQNLEKLKNENNVERDNLIEKYELRLAKHVASQTSQNAIKESQISSLKSKLIKLEFEHETEKQKWKEILTQNDDIHKKKKHDFQLPNDDLMYQQDDSFESKLYQKLESANKEIIYLNTTNQQLYLRIGHLREELLKLKEVKKSSEDKKSSTILETKETQSSQCNQLMIQDLKDKITKEMHFEVVSLMHRLHQQEDELIYIKTMWNKTLTRLRLFECEGNNSSVFGMDKLEILMAGLLNEESHLNMNILGIKYLTRLTKSVNEKSETSKYHSPLTDKPSLARYLKEPIKTAFNRLHSTTQQLRDLVKSLTKSNSHYPSLELYPATKADVICGELPGEGLTKENTMFRPFIGISSISSGAFSANGSDEESQRMIMLECDLNHQAKVLLELMRSYNGLQEALVGCHTSPLHAQRGINKKSVDE